MSTIPEHEAQSLMEKLISYANAEDVQSVSPDEAVRMLR